MRSPVGVLGVESGGRSAIEPALRRRVSDMPGRARWLVAVDDRTALWAAALGACAIVVAGVVLGAILNIWGDEAFTLWTTGAGPLEAWGRVVRFEDQPPLYFVIEACWRLANETSIAFARLPSVFFAAATVAVIVLAMHRIAPRFPPALVALLSALNPVFVWAAAEMRVYALVLFVGAALSWSFVEAFLLAPRSRRARVVYTLVALAGLYTQYYVGFVLLAQCLVLVAMRRSVLRGFIVSMALVALGFAPFARVAIIDVEASGPFVSHVTFLKAAHEVANVAFAFILPHDINWSGSVKLAGFALAAILIATLFAVGRPVLRGSPARAAVLQWVFCLAVFTLLFAFSGVPLDPMRHLMVLFPPSVIVSVVLLAGLTRRRLVTVAAGVVVFAVFAGTSLWESYRPPLAKLGDWQRVATFLAATDPAVPIAVFPAESALPLHVYLPRTTIPIPRPMPFSLDYVGATTLHSEADVAQVLDPLRSVSPNFWLVTKDECPAANVSVYAYNCGYLEAYLQNRYRLVRRVEFRGSIARLFERLAPVSSLQPVHDGD